MSHPRWHSLDAAALMPLSWCHCLDATLSFLNLNVTEAMLSVDFNLISLRSSCSDYFILLLHHWLDFLCIGHRHYRSLFWWRSFFKLMMTTYLQWRDICERLAATWLWKTSQELWMLSRRPWNWTLTARKPLMVVAGKTETWFSLCFFNIFLRSSKNVWLCYALAILILWRSLYWLFS